MGYNPASGATGQKWAIKYLSANFTTDSGVLTDLGFTNLVAGNTYEFILCPVLQCDDTQLEKHLTITDGTGGGTILWWAGSDRNTAAGDANHSNSKSTIYTMSNTAIEVVSSSLAGSNMWRGDGTRYRTHLIIKEIASPNLTTEWD